MKTKRLIYITVIFFVIINTSYFWEKYVNFFLLLFIILLLGLTYIYILVKFIIRLNTAFGEKFKNRLNLMSIITASVVLILITICPRGIINFDRLEGQNLFIAYREGSANCMTYLKLKDNNKFKYTCYCFGIDEIRGEYKLNGDTIFFYPKKQDINPFKYAVVKNSNELIMYYNKNDSLKGSFTITENKLQ